MSTNKSKVDYATVTVTTEAQAKRLASTVGTRFARHEATGASLTVECVNATRQALHVGYLADGRKSKDSTALTGAEFGATHFGLSTGALVTFWTTLAIAQDRGVVVGSVQWQDLCGRKLAKRSEVSKAVRDPKATLSSIGKAVKATTSKPPKPRAGKAQDEGTEDRETAVSPLDSAKAHLAGLASDLKSPAVGPDEYDIVRRILVGLLAGEDKRRAWGVESPATTRPAAPAAPSSGDRSTGSTVKAPGGKAPRPGVVVTPATLANAKRKAESKAPTVKPDAATA